MNWGKELISLAFTLILSVLLCTGVFLVSHDSYPFIGGGCLGLFVAIIGNMLINLIIQDK